jgi:hypothetical protein
MGLSTAGRNQALNSWAAQAQYASLHTAYPGNNGANEVSGGSPAYARKAISWASASGGRVTQSGSVSFDVPGSTTIGWVGFWTAATGGTFLGSAELGAVEDPQPFYAAASTDQFEVESHGFANGDAVVVFDVGNLSALPGGITKGTIYYVRDVSGDSFKLAATSGGSAIDLSSNGSGTIKRIQVVTFAAQGTYLLSGTEIALL